MRPSIPNELIRNIFLLKLKYKIIFIYFKVYFYKFSFFLTNSNEFIYYFHLSVLLHLLHLFLLFQTISLIVLKIIIRCHLFYVLTIIQVLKRGRRDYLLAGFAFGGRNPWRLWSTRVKIRQR